MVSLGIVMLRMGSTGADGGSEAAKACEFGVVESGVVFLWRAGLGGHCDKY